MIRTSIFVRSNSFFTILKLPFVQKIEIAHISKTSRTDNCLYRIWVHLKDINHFSKQLFSTITPESIVHIQDRRHIQQILDCLIELEKTGKIKNKNFKRLVEYADLYNLHIPNKKEYLKQIEILKSLSLMKT